jgi:hypothetical protein
MWLSRYRNCLISTVHRWDGISGLSTRFERKDLQKIFLASKEKAQLRGATHIILPYFDYFILRHSGAANTLNVRDGDVTHNLVGNVGYRASSVGR